MAFRHISECLPKGVTTMTMHEDFTTKVTLAETYLLDGAFFSAARQLREMVEALEARAELTFAHALLNTDGGKHTERNHTNGVKRVEHALEALGWPLTGEAPTEAPKLYSCPVRKP